MIDRIRMGALALLLAAAAAACGDVGDAPKAKTGEAVDVAQATGGTYAIDTSRSKVGWKAAKVTRAHDGGFRGVNGTVNVDNGNVTGARINIDATTIWADDDNLTGHLKSDDFFGVEKFPGATFEASSFEKLTGDTSGATHRVTGNLTMHGVTKSVTFPAKVNVSENEVTANADFKINRKDWGLVYPGAPDDLISDDVRIIFDVTAVRSQPSA